MLNYRGSDSAFQCEEELRNVGIANVLRDKPLECKIITIEGLECKICSMVIPVERQQLVLTMKETCDYCAGCQEMLERKKYAPV